MRGGCHIGLQHMLTGALYITHMHTHTLCTCIHTHIHVHTYMYTHYIIKMKLILEIFKIFNLNSTAQVQCRSTIRAFRCSGSA